MANPEVRARVEVLQLTLTGRVLMAGMPAVSDPAGRLHFGERERGCVSLNCMGQVSEYPT